MTNRHVTSQTTNLSADDINGREDGWFAARMDHVAPTPARCGNAAQRCSCREATEQRSVGDWRTANGHAGVPWRSHEPVWVHSSLLLKVVDNEVLQCLSYELAVCVQGSWRSLLTRYVARQLKEDEGQLKAGGVREVEGGGSS